jgi:KaiC/GvpD/RAD55 family RecA-like ATPase
MLIEDITEEHLQATTLIYGPAGAGKTTPCLEALQGRSIYVSTSKNFSLERLQKLRNDHADIIRQLVLFEPTDLLELEKAVQAAVQFSAMSSILVIDSIATHVRAADRKLGNLALHRILETLKKAKCPVLLTSEVYDYLSESKGVQFVGGDMLRLASRTILELNDGAMTIKKHPVHAGRSWDYKITDTGLQKV